MSVTKSQIQESQRRPNRLTAKETAPRYIILNYRKSKIKEILERARERKTNVRLTTDFSETMKAR